MTRCDQPTISIIIPVYNQVQLLDRCLASLRAQSARAVQIIVVNDASPEDPTAVLQRYPEATCLTLSENQGYASANNAGLQEAKGEKLLFLNSDTELPPDLLERMSAYLDEHPEVGGVAPLHRDFDGGVQRTCYRFPDLRTGLIWDSIVHRRNPEHPLIRSYQMSDWDHQSARSVEHAQTSCLLIRREAFDRIGGMDPNLSLFYNDTDYCRRMELAGFRTQFVPEFEIRHYGNASVATVATLHSQVYGDRYRYYRKWFGWRGAVVVRLALWSRVAHEALTELLHGDPGSATRKIRRGLQVHRAMVPRP